MDAADRRILVLAAQALGGLAVEPLYVLVDTAIVGRLGTAQLGGVALAASVLSLVVNGSNFLSYGTTERVAWHLGAGLRQGAARVGVQALWLAAAISTVVVPMLLLGARPLGRLLGGDGDVLDSAVTYLAISATGVPFVLVAIASQGVLRGQRDYRTPLVILLLANSANVILELVMVYGLDLGIAGSAWSTVIVQVGAAWAFLVAIRRRLVDTDTWRPHWEAMRPLLAAGRHLLVRVGAMLVVLGGSTAVAARIDEPTLAAHQVAMSLFVFLALVLDAFAIPAQTLVAGELGAGRRGGALAVAHRVQRLSLLAAAVVAALIAAGAALLPHAFSADPAVTDRATVAFLWVAVLMLPGAVAFAHDGVLIGAADYRFLGLAAVAYLTAMLPIAVLVLQIDGLGITGLWGGLTTWMLLRAIVNARRTQHLLGTPAA